MQAEDNFRQSAVSEESGPRTEVETQLSVGAQSVTSSVDCVVTEKTDMRNFLFAHIITTEFVIMYMKDTWFCYSLYGCNASQ